MLRFIASLRQELMVSLQGFLRHSHRSGWAMLSECGAFLQQFVRHPKQMGATIPTARHLADRAIDAASVDTASSVVELGSGTGSVTERIRRRLKPGARFFAVECNPVLADATRRRCSDVPVYCGDADQLDTYLKNEGMSQVDAIISAIPWACVGDEKQEQLLNVIWRSLRPGGKFATLAYPMGLFMPDARRFQKRFYRMFHRAGSTPIVWANIPPGFIYYGEK